jgi:uncharacterized membrane protein
MAQEDAPQPTGEARVSRTGLSVNLASALCYVPSPFAGVVLHFLETHPTVRFHAVQSILFGIAWIAFWTVFTSVADIFYVVPLLYLLVLLFQLLSGIVIQTVAFVIWLVLVIRAGQGARFKLPVLGNLAERYVAVEESRQRGAIAYVLGPITGVVLLLQDHDPFVRFHAWQSILLSFAWFGISVVLGLMIAMLAPMGVFYLVEITRAAVLGLGFLYVWLTTMSKAISGEQVKLPYIGELAERYASR